METERKRLDIAPKLERTVAPSSGFAEVPNEAEVRATSFLTSIISARQEAQLLFELAQTLGNSLSLKETLSVVAVRLKEMIRTTPSFFFVSQEGVLIPEYVHGLDYDLFTSLRILWDKVFRLGRSQREADHQRQSGRRNLHLGPSSPNTTPVCTQRSAPRPRRRRRCADLLPSRKKRLLQGSFALALGCQLQTRAFGRECPPVEQAQSTPAPTTLRACPTLASICDHLEKELTRIRRFKKTAAVLCATSTALRRSTTSSAT